MFWISSYLFVFVYFKGCCVTTLSRDLIHIPSKIMYIIIIHCGKYWLKRLKEMGILFWAQQTKLQRLLIVFWLSWNFQKMLLVRQINSLKKLHHTLVGYGKGPRHQDINLTHQPTNASVVSHGVWCFVKFCFAFYLFKKNQCQTLIEVFKCRVHLFVILFNFLGAYVIHHISLLCHFLCSDTLSESIMKGLSEMSVFTLY